MEKEGKASDNYPEVCADLERRENTEHYESSLETEELGGSEMENKSTTSYTIMAKI